MLFLSYCSSMVAVYMDNIYIQGWNINSSSRNEKRSYYMWTSTQGENDFYPGMKLILKVKQLKSRGKMFISGLKYLQLHA